MFQEEHHEYFLALRRWYIMHAGSAYEAIAFRLSMGNVHDYGSQGCYACKVGTLNSDRVCGNCGFIDIPLEQVSHLELPVLEAAANIRRGWMAASKHSMESYVEDYTNEEEFLKGLEERAQETCAMLSELEGKVLTNLRAWKSQQKIGQALSELAQMYEAGLEKAANHAQRHVEKVMYYGQEMVLPDSPFWGRLNSEQQGAMLIRQITFQDWWTRPTLIAVLLYCATAPFVGIVVAMLIGVGVMTVMTAIVVSWYNAALDLLLKQIATVAVFAGLAFLVIASWSNWTNVFLALGGWVLLSLLGDILSALLRRVFWQIRNTLMK